MCAPTGPAISRFGSAFHARVLWEEAETPFHRVAPHPRPTARPLCLPRHLCRPCPPPQVGALPRAHGRAVRTAWERRPLPTARGNNTRTRVCVRRTAVRANPTCAPPCTLGGTCESLFSARGHLPRRAALIALFPLSPRAAATLDALATAGRPPPPSTRRRARRQPTARARCVCAALDAACPLRHTPARLRRWPTRPSHGRAPPPRRSDDL